MKALIWSENSMFEMREIDDPIIKSPKDVKVKIHLTGICGTDLALVTGKEKGSSGIIRGHEAVGTIVDTGSDVHLVSPGDRVVIDPNQYCGQCYHCRRGETHLCSGDRHNGLKIAGLNVHGTFAEYFVCDERFVHRLPEHMEWETALMIEPLACVLHNFTEAAVSPDDAVLVIGAGPMGMVCQSVSRKLCRLTAAVETDRYRYDFAKSISDYVFKPEELELDKILELNSGRKFDVVIDAVGNQLEIAEKYVARGGKIVLLGLDPTYTFRFSPAAYWGNAIKILGCGEYHQMFDTALGYATRDYNLKEMVTKKYPLEEYETAISELLGYDIRSKAAVDRSTVKTAFYM